MQSIRFADFVRESLSTTARIIHALGHWLAGGAARKAAAGDLADGSSAFADSVFVDEFEIHPSSFYAYTKLLPVAYFVGLQVLTSDINGTLPLSSEMVDDLERCAKGIGIRLRRFGMLFGAGATDAAESARRGIRLTTIIAMPTEIIRHDLVYHTPDDIVERIEPAAVEACLRIAAAYVALLESRG